MRKFSQSSNFDCFISGLEKLGYGVATTILDAQYRGLAQRRERVFVVGCAGGKWQRAASVLLDQSCLSGNPPPSRAARERVAPTVESRAEGGGGGWGTDFLTGGGGLAEVSTPAPSSTGATGSIAASLFPPEVADTLRSGSTSPAAHNKQNGTDRETLVPEVVGTLSDGAHMGGGRTGKTHIREELSPCLNAGGMGRQDYETEALVPVRQGGFFDKVTVGHLNGTDIQDGKDRANSLSTGNVKQPDTVIAFDTTQITSKTNRSNPQIGDPCNTMAKGADAPAIAFQPRIDRNGRGDMGDKVNALNSSATGASDAAPCVAFRACGQDGFTPSNIAPPVAATDGGGANAPTMQQGYSVRRLTPVECARLQGFPDHYLDIDFKGKPATDSHKYRALGNSMAVPVIRWLGERIAMVDKIK